MRPLQIALALGMTLVATAGVYFRLHPLLTVPAGLIAAGLLIVIAAQSPDQV